MSNALRNLAVIFFLLLTWGGGLAVSGSFTDPGLLKAPVMLAGMTGLVLLYIRHLRPSLALIPFLVFWMYGYFRLTHTGEFQTAAVMQVGVLLAFLLGYLRAPLAHRRLMPPLILLCVARGLIDLITLAHLGAGPGTLAASDLTSSYNVTSFFLDKHFFGGLLILGAFHHFYLMEKGDPHKPVQVLLYSASLLVLLSILLVDSRAVMGVFFLCFLPLLFLSLRLDGKEPRLERLAWITGITLSLGIAWINLPEMQLHKMAAALTHVSVGFLPWVWKSAWHTFSGSPWVGWGIGGFRFAVTPFEGLWPARDGDALPAILHAENHFLESLAEGGMVGFALEILLIAGAVYGCARVYFREWRLEAKYVFFSLAALLMLGQFCPILEQAPARLVLWALIGYGWSLVAEGLPRGRFHGLGAPQLSVTARALAGGALISLACLHLWLRVPELKSDHLYAKAFTLFNSNPRASTDMVVQALRANPGNEAANYAYIGVLSEFNRESDAVSLAAHVQSFAPDSMKKADVLARIYCTMDKYDSAAKYASVVLMRYPHFLPAMEILMESYKHERKCESLDSLRMQATAWNETYPLPEPQDFTIGGLDSLFHSNRQVVFLQRWFGGKDLRQRFVEDRLNKYNQRILNHTRVRSLQESRCLGPGGQGPDGEPLDGDAEKDRSGLTRPRARRLFRGFG